LRSLSKKDKEDNGEDVVILGDRDLLTLPDLLPGWQVAISDLWAPEFD
jgi:hypothetical protein